ncbi:hypothetical protein ACERJO_19430 [Halalkalibacter sp. AB-rgal2]|uniref:hypothetical protein n=1 Tax=Halalkalibacter sp. AB-rgal2 TaxID=3242695 RepID=UPI00359CCD00
MDFLIEFQWELFIAAEVLSITSLLLFGYFRYFLGQQRISLIFILGFIGFLILEVLLGLYIYERTGEFSTILLVMTIFVIYACTFGIADFIRLDRWMRRKIGQFRGVELLSKKDYNIIERNKNPNYIAKKYRISAFIHLIIFFIVQAIFWHLGTSSTNEMVKYITDFSWIETGSAANSPYANETMYAIGMIWGIVFIVDFLYSISYTIFPNKKA